MGFRDKFRKKQDSEDDGGASPATPEFTFIRTDTFTQEVIRPPSFDGPADRGSFLTAEPSPDAKQRRSLDVFRGSRSRSASASSARSSSGLRFPQRLRLSRSPASSENVPADLPDIVVPEGGEEDKEGTELQWEKRATILARETDKHRSRPSTPVHGSAPPGPQLKAVSSKAIDDDIQEAIRLHEAGRLEESTALFARLADPKGANNPLSQVLYGLALRYARLLPSTRSAGGPPRVHVGAM